MLTPQDIQNKEFTKAVFGGYDMAGVDDFLEEVTTDYAALYKENAVLKGKLKVLVEKVEEYRSTEDAMRMALLTAQNMSDDIMDEAKKKSGEILAEAENAAELRKKELDADFSLEEARLAAAKAETAKFVSEARLIMEKYGEFLEKVTEMTGGFAPAAPVYRDPEEPMWSPEPEPREVTNEEMASIVAETMSEAFSDEATRPIPTITPDEALDPDDSPTRRLDIEWDEEAEELTPRPKFKFDDLKFGKNYDNE